ncbi:MAG: site-2 protease family protein [Candidatus Eremiobacteraeota bacterium]|nr:site-2 protease family protein [Candidatus Eremiobacteraeota bacterium]
MFGPITIAKVKGIPIKIDFSWIIVFALVTSTLGSELGNYLKNLNPISLVFWAVIGSLVFFLSLLLHEMSHAIVAQKEKIGVKSVTLFIFGGVAQLTREPESPGSEFRMAAAGPAVSILLGIFFLVIWYLAIQASFSPPVILLAQILGITNLALGIFNLVPAFPLDGGRIFRAIVWAITKDLHKATGYAVTLGRLFAFILALWGITDLVRADIITGFWKIFIGFFLYQIASASLRMMTVRKAISGSRVADIMTSPPVTVPPYITVAQLVYEYFLVHRIFSYPVTENGTPVGIISTEEIRKIPRENWDYITVSQVMKPVTDDMLISSEEDMENAFCKMSGESKERLLVLYEGKLVGVLSLSDVTRFVEIKKRLDENGDYVTEIQEPEKHFKA